VGLLFLRSPIFTKGGRPGQAERNAETGDYAAQQDAGIPIGHGAFKHRIEKKKDSTMRYASATATR
jgi:hypothetical protein